MTPGCYRFLSRNAFLAACDAAGWPRDGLTGEPSLPLGVSLDEIGPLVDPPTLGQHGVMTPGAVVDARWHVNALWSNGQEPPAGFAAAQVSPPAAARTYSGVDMTPPVTAPAVPSVVSAWKAKAVLLQMGLLDTATAAVEAAGGVARLAWDAAEWERNSALISSLGAGLGLSSADIDAAFIAAAGLQG